MKSVLSVLEPDAIEMRLVISMSLRSWRKLDEQLNQVPGTHISSYPIADLRVALREMVQKATTHFEPDDETED